MTRTDPEKPKVSAEILAQADSSPTLQWMIAQGDPLTRETFVCLAYLGEKEIEDLSAEELAAIPRGLE